MNETDTENYIDNVITRNKKIKLCENISKDSVILIDFWNMYCNYIKFSKYNVFTYKSYNKLLSNVCEYFKEYADLVIVSKEIYESNGENFIIEMANKYPNITYYMVKDKDNLNPGKNRERDDFYLLYKYFMFKCTSKKAYIISNDKFKN